VNPWPGHPRLHAKAARKGWRKRKHGKGRRRTTKRCRPCKPRRGAHGRFTGGYKRADAAALANPSFSFGNPPALYANAGIGSMSTWVGFTTAAVATAVGLIAADFVDRIVATRTPADDGTTKGVRPWYGRDAAAAQRMRPDAWRLGAQAGGAVIALGLAFWTRNVKLLPWILGGVALGFGSNLLFQLAKWWLMPAILKIDKESDLTLANRTYVLEQSATQDTVTGIFEKWSSNPSLLAAQGAEGSQVILGPLASSGAATIYALGKGQPNGNGAGAVGVVNTGRLGLCPHCKQMNGCLSSCPTLCPKCPEYNPATHARYPVVAGDNLTQLAALGGVSVADVSAMNGGQTPDQFWHVGNVVKVPYGMAMAIDMRDKSRSNGSVGTPEPVAPTPVVPAAIAPAAPAEVVAQAKSLNLHNFGLEDNAE
jgi:hypothetical protein